MSAWKRFTVAGCSHGHLVDPRAAKAFFDFVREFQPETRMHTGDWCDMTAFRKGAKGTPDERANIALDLSAGKRFIEEYRATHLLNGNHDVRVYKYLDSTNAIEVDAASRIITDMRDLTRKLDCKFMESYDIRKSWFELGDAKVLHGFFYSVSAIRDHAETFGKCIHTHIHRLGQDTGRRIDSPTAYSAGYLANEDLLDYGHTRRQTLAHKQGFAWGVYNDTKSIVNIAGIEGGICQIAQPLAA